MVLSVTGVDIGSLSASWQKSFHDDNRIQRSDGTGVLALSAFILSSLPTSIARKTLVKEMWESGAEIMVGPNDGLIHIGRSHIGSWTRF